MRLNRTKQCAKCPWKVETDPREIPNGYDEEKHRALESTIADPGSLADLGRPVLRQMACHESHDDPCLGWLMNQLGPGNNLALRIRYMGCENLGAVELVGEQHERLADTLPS